MAIPTRVESAENLGDANSPRFDKSVVSCPTRFSSKSREQRNVAMCFFNSYKKHPEAFIFQSCTYIDFNVIYGRPLIENPKDLEDLARVASPSDCQLGGKARSEGCSHPPTQRSPC